MTITDDTPTRDATRYVLGNLAPVHEERTVSERELRVTGTIPAELDGRYVRNGPNPVRDIDPANHHWFVGDGMVHGVHLRDGKAQWYRNRYVRSPKTLEALGEPQLPLPFAADRPTSVANTNVIGLAGRTFAIVEAGGAPVELDFELNTIGCTDLDGGIPAAFSAHPKADPATGSLHAVGYFWPMGDVVQYLVIGADATVQLVQDIPLGHGYNPMMHELSITATRAVLYDLPCVFDMDAAMSGAGLPYRWKPEIGARIGLLPLGGGDVTWCQLDEPCYVFHSYNAFDDADGRVVMDCVVHPSVGARDVHGPNDGVPRVERWTIDPSTGRVDQQVVSTRYCEFPRVDERLLGRHTRIGYASMIGKQWEHGDLLRIDFDSGEEQLISHGAGRGTMETVFIPRAESGDETDGWLMSMVHDATTETTDLVILDADSPHAGPVATVHIPARVPYGFHGNWIPS
jgi:carotenoid cleavage dioxygenase-like enzyme